MRQYLIFLVLFLAGCCGTPDFDRPPTTGMPWDTTYLIDVDPLEVTPAELTSAVAAAETRLKAATVDGVVWPRSRSDETMADADQFHSGGDSLLFTGIANATWAWKYMVSNDPADFQQIVNTLNGLDRMTHVAGNGVLCRCVLPLDRANEFQWPWPWREPFIGEADGYGYYTRATRDQITGLLVGLSWSWRATLAHGGPEALAAQNTILKIVLDVHQKLVNDGWKIRDAKGENDTSADDVDGLLRMALEAMVAIVKGQSTDEVSQDLVDHFGSSVEGIIAWTNRFNNFDQYYAHNLRATRMLTIAGMMPFLSSDVKDAALTHSERSWWRYVKGHRSAWFDAIWISLGGDNRDPHIRYSLSSLALKPTRQWASPYAGQEQAPGLLDAFFGCTDGYVVDPHLRKPTNYTTWQKEPWDVGEPEIPGTRGTLEDIGLGMTSAYWLWQYAK